MVDPAMMREFARMLATEMVNVGFGAAQRAMSPGGTANPPVHTVIRTDPNTGNPIQVQTTTPQLLAELNDHLADLIDVQDEALDEADRKGRRRRRR